MTMTRALALTLVILFGWTLSDAEASCSGSGTSWTCSAGTTPAEVNAAIGSATDGATLTFAAGSYTWGGGTVIAPPLNKSITMICASVGACNVAYSGQFPGTWRPGCCAGGSSDKLYRISGFNFTAAAGATLWFAWDDSAETTLSRLRIDHNTWTLGTDDAVMNVSIATAVYFYGVWDHNTITAATMTTIPFLYTPAQDPTSPVTGRLGSANNFFFEDNVITATTGGGNGCLDGFGTPVGWVWRFNTITNCRMTTHGVSHGFGPSNLEYYGNSLIYNASATFPDGYRSIHHQGSGTAVFWGNRWTTSSAISTTAIALLHYRSFEPHGAPACAGTNAIDGNRSPTSTYLGYPCFHQPGRDLNALLYPIPSFDNINTSDGAKVDLVINGGGGGAATPDYTTFHLKENREFYNAVAAGAQTSPTSPFNGTTGMGFGTLANRPTTCTTTTQSADAGRGGVLYWATDQGSWNQSTSNPRGVQRNGADGVLYMCTATNTWTVYYTPYTYPHPLQSGGGGGGAPAAPAAPANVRIIP
jgi:hypothetical protein